MKSFFTIFFIVTASNAFCQEMYEYKTNKVPAWASFENKNGRKGAGGKENSGAKGHPSQYVLPGEKIELLNYDGTGIINRIWLTIDKRNAATLRSAKIEMFWDGSPTPAVSVPIGDFFGNALGIMKPFENELFADPEGRSFISYIKMPFRKRAKVFFNNESADTLKLYYDIDFIKGVQSKEMLYFHAYWHRQQPTQLSHDFELLPYIKGRGKFLGVNVGVITDSVYNGSWWGEGEVKFYIDNDFKNASLVGTGTEDYIGTAWGQGTFNNRYSGCTVADEKNNLWAFYRFHIPDPIYFSRNIKVTLQQIGGAAYEQYLRMKLKNAPMIAVTADDFVHHKFYNFLANSDESIEKLTFTNCWINFYRQDDVAATSYFYLDIPGNAVPALNKKNQKLVK